MRVFEKNHRARTFYEKLGCDRLNVTWATPPFPVLLEYALLR
jgi:hypothetical protein